MARTEIVERRGRYSKTFDNGDGTFTTEVGGEHAHHQANGKWVETDTYLYGGNTEVVDPESGESYTHETREHPVKIRLNKFKQPLRVGAGVLRPLDSRQVAGVKSVNRVTYSQPWDGIDVERVVTPEGLTEVLHITSAAGQRVVEWACDGDIVMGAAPSWRLDRDGGTIAYTFDGDTLAYDLTTVPVGAEVVTWLR